jgi:hypothetical protein
MYPIDAIKVRSYKLPTLQIFILTRPPTDTNANPQPQQHTGLLGRHSQYLPNCPD